MDRVNVRLFRDFERFLVLNTDFHLACRLDLFALIHERDVIEPGKRQCRVLIILVLHFAQGLRVVLLVNFRICLPGDLPCLEFYTHGQLCGHAKIGVDIIVPAFKYKLRILCDQFDLRSGFDNCFSPAFL